MLPILKFLKLVLIAALSGAACLLLAAVTLYFYLAPDLPDVNDLKSVQLQTPLRIYSSDHKLMAEFGEKRRSPVLIEKVPALMIDAFVAAEDNRFFSHPGFDLKGLGRAVFQLVTFSDKRSGGSTITMQVAKNYFLTHERSFIRKARELILAIRIERALTKQEILELYVNKIYLGNRAYGIQAASTVYYGKPLNELSLAQMAMIAGLPKAPSKYNPIVNPERALIRRDWILGRMLFLGMISQSEYDQAIATPVNARYHLPVPELEAPWIAEMARLEMIKRHGPQAMSGGYKVFLTVDSKLQEAAAEAVKKGLEAYDIRHGYRGPEFNIFTAPGLSEPVVSPEKLSDLASREPSENTREAAGKILEILTAQQTTGSLIPGIVLLVDHDSAKVLTEEGEQITLYLKEVKWASRYLSVNQKSSAPEQMSEVVQAGDVILLQSGLSGNSPGQAEGQWRLAQIPDVQGALVSVDPRNGALKAVVGGYDYRLSRFNRAVQAERQPGSNFKPFLYLAALEDGYTAASLVNDSPLVFGNNESGSAWRPRNSGQRYDGDIRLRKALYQSKNLVSIRLLKDIGVNRTRSYAERFGFNPEKLPVNLSLALGNAAVTPLQLAESYSAIANGGYRVTTHFIERIEKDNGDIVFRARPETVPVSNAAGSDTLHARKLPTSARVADEQAVFIMHSMLQDVIRKGTGRKALTLGRNDIAGKTGTTNDQKDAWFSGFNPNLVTTVWVGFDHPETLGKHEYGSRAALPVWIDFMDKALKGQPETYMEQPAGMVNLRLDFLSEASGGEDPFIYEVFRERYAPRHVAKRYSFQMSEDVPEVF